MRRSVSGGCLAIALAGWVGLAGAQSSREYVVVGDARIGPLSTTGGSIADARRAFGAPQTQRRSDQFHCTLIWPGLGLELRFFGAGTSCAPGVLDAAVVRGSQWRTDRGLGIGNPATRLRALYPRAHARVLGGGRAEWALITHHLQSLPGGHSFPPQVTLRARTRAGRVAAFIVGQLAAEGVDRLGP